MQAILFDSARLTIEPLVRIIKGSRGADTSVTLRTILAGNNARDTSQPYLEIDENNVKARHSATIGKIGDDELFYLQSRGLEKSEAEKIMIMGVINEFMKYIPLQNQSDIFTLLKPFDLIPSYE